jgi:hypothetical protein
MNFLNHTRDAMKLLTKPWKPKNHIFHFKFTRAITKTKYFKE